MYEFLDFRLDVERLELFERDQRIQGEPRTLEFLAYLVEHRDRVVGKDELIRELWQARAVSDAAIARCASDARRLLGDTERPYRVIETVYGRGYRLAAEVRRSGATGSRPERPSDTEPLGSSGGPRPVPAPAAGRSSPARRAWPVVALAIFGTVVAFGWLVLGRGDQPAAGSGQIGGAAPMTPISLAVQWRSASEPELQLVAMSMAELVVEAVATDSAVAMARAGRASAAAPSQETSAQSSGEGEHSVLIEVSRSAMSGHAQVDASFVPGRHTPTGALQLGRFALPLLDGTQQALDHHLLTRDALVAQLAERLEESVGVVLRGRSAGLAPADAEAWKLYLDATANWSVACRDGDSDVLLERAVELDPGFAAAWYALAGARLARANLCGAPTTSLSEVRLATERATEAAGEWPAPYQLRAALSLYEGDTDDAYRQLRDAAVRFSSDYFVGLRKAEALRYAGFLDRSLAEYERASAIWPGGSKLTDTVPYPYLYLQQWEQFLEQASGRDSPFFRYYRGWAQWRLGLTSEAVATLEPAFQTEPGDLFGRLSQALLSILQDRPAEAGVVLDQLIRQREMAAHADGEVGYKIAQLLSLANRPLDAIDQLGLALEQGFFCPRCLDLEPAFEPLRDLEAYLATRERVVARHRAFAERFALAPES